MLANHECWRLMHFYTPLLLLLQPSVQWLSIVNFHDDAKPPPKWILCEFDVLRIRPRPGGLPHLETFTWQNLTPAERVTRSGRPGYCLGGSPHLSCKRDQIKMRDYMDRRVTPPKRVTSPTWGPPPPSPKERYSLYHQNLAYFPQMYFWIVKVLTKHINGLGFDSCQRKVIFFFF